MVFFTCDGCNETLKKNQVDRHAQRCRKCVSVSCVDCLVSFFGDDYRQHTSCLTEVERYEKRGPNQRANKKLSPQDAWMDVVTSSVDTAPGHLRSKLQVIAGLDNVPRKEKQFRNFAANSLNLRGRNNNAEKIVGEIWNYLKSQRNLRQQQTQQQDKGNKESNGESMEEESKQVTPPPPEPEKEATEESGSTSAHIAKSKSAQTDELTLASVKKAMRAVLKKTEGKSLPLKKLRKVVRGKLGLAKDGKKKLRELVQKNVASEKKFVLDGATVTLRVD